MAGSDALVNIINIRRDGDHDMVLYLLGLSINWIPEW